MNRQTAVIGLGIFGREIALTLASDGHPVMAIDIDAQMIDEVKDHVTQTLIMDATNEQALLDARIERMDTVVNAIGTQHLQNSILTTALLAHMGIQRIIARATNALHERILRQVGATEVINPEREIGRKIARRIAQPRLREILDMPDGVCVAELPVPPSFVGRTLAELNVRQRHKLNVIGVQRVRLMSHVVEPDEASLSTPDPTLDSERRMILDVAPEQDTFLEDDILVVIGREGDIQHFAAVD